MSTSNNTNELLKKLAQEALYYGKKINIKSCVRTSPPIREEDVNEERRAILSDLQNLIEATNAQPSDQENGETDKVLTLFKLTRHLEYLDRHCAILREIAKKFPHHS